MTDICRNMKLSQSCREIENGECKIMIKVSKEELRTESAESRKTNKRKSDMCIKLPMNKQEMLNVNGIGESKYEKYEERFIEKLRDFTKGEKMKLYYEEASAEQESESRQIMPGRWQA